MGVRVAVALLAVPSLLSACGLVLDADARQGEEPPLDSSVLTDGSVEDVRFEDSDMRTDGMTTDGSPGDATVVADAMRPDSSTTVDGSAADATMALRGFGEGCSDGGNAVCESGRCDTLWDGYFCYYTACNITCAGDSDCETALNALGIRGVGRCNTGSMPATCDLRDLMLGDEACE
jgi:hypothetical protein